MKKIILLMLLSFSVHSAKLYNNPIDGLPGARVYSPPTAEVFLDPTTGETFIGLDLKLKDMGMRWVQDLETGSGRNGMRLFGTMGITNNTDMRFGWNRSGIDNPLSSGGSDSVMFEYKYKFD